MSKTLVSSLKSAPLVSSPLRFWHRGQVMNPGNVPPDRTLLDLLREDLRAAEEARIQGRKRDMYKALGRAAGMDVETMEREAEAERAAEAAAAKRRLDANARALATEGPGQ